jgi:hypothetical protein
VRHDSFLSGVRHIRVPHRHILLKDDRVIFLSNRLGLPVRKGRYLLQRAKPFLRALDFLVLEACSRWRLKLNLVLFRHNSWDLFGLLESGFVFVCHVQHGMGFALHEVDLILLARVIERKVVGLINGIFAILIFVLITVHWQQVDSLRHLWLFKALLAVFLIHATVVYVLSGFQPASCVWLGLIPILALFRCVYEA